MTFKRIFKNKRNALSRSTSLKIILKCNLSIEAKINSFNIVYKSYIVNKGNCVIYLFPISNLENKERRCTILKSLI